LKRKQRRKASRQRKKLEPSTKRFSLNISKRRKQKRIKEKLHLRRKKHLMLEKINQLLQVNSKNQ